jgi:hypothetical protein
LEDVFKTQPAGSSSSSNKQQRGIEAVAIVKKSGKDKKQRIQAKRQGKPSEPARRRNDNSKGGK